MDRIIERIIEILEAEVKTPRGIKQICNGDPLSDTPVASMPLIIVKGNGTRSLPLDNLNNQDVFDIDILVLMDARTQFNKLAFQNTVEREVRKIVEERESASNKPKSDTVMGAMQQDFQFEDTFNMRVEITETKYGADVMVQHDREFPIYGGVLSLAVYSRDYSISA